MATKIYLLGDSAMVNNDGTLKAPLGPSYGYGGGITYIPINCERIEYTVVRKPNIFAIPVSSYNAAIDYGAKTDSLHITGGILSGTTPSQCGHNYSGWMLRGTSLSSLNLQQQRVYLLSALGAGPWGNVDIIPAPNTISGNTHDKVEPYKLGTIVYPSFSKIHWGDPSVPSTKLLCGPIIVDKYTLREIGGEPTKYEFDLDCYICGIKPFSDIFTGTDNLTY